MIDGKKVKLGSTEYIIAPLNFKSLKRLRPELDSVASVGGVVNDSIIEAALKIIHAAISRNHPDMSIEQLEEVIDMGNFNEVLDAVLGQSGFAKGKPTGGSESGEA